MPSAIGCEGGRYDDDDNNNWPYLDDPSRFGLPRVSR
jgi:hypothetical protein